MTVLAKAMAKSIWGGGSNRHQVSTAARKVTLKTLMSAFWDGYVRWSAAAHEDLLFWRQVNFERLHGPISGDTLEVLASGMSIDTKTFDTEAMSIHFNQAEFSPDAKRGEVAGQGGTVGPPMRISPRRMPISLSLSAFL